ncbi:NAD(P)-dependent oxidoreductase [Pleurocapsa sp. CCALA 161]|uniref:NAD-dependent epimerase/dehydratase family protein n=1 Tax=Pleurocapsa sp. CCALA 161 TaxID=2107688 RepID=UPI000D064FAA|nr:NAD-dependent epimerase/dehydratase family protein [Pleurocapsa sp. CCALA 161]PSB07440.1 NAD(P)-dependent oxidoreductase [Pleurocapsa sp. CCALA 161]
MKLAIIGCGYVGSAVARLWHAAGNEVTVTTTTTEKVEELQAIASKVVILTGDDLSSLQQVVANQDVILLSIGSKQRTPEIYRQTYLATAQNLVKAIKNNSGVKQLIYTSSYGLINHTSGDTIDETVTVKPKDEFGEILAQTEQVLLNASATDLTTCILRLTGIYGPDRELIKIFKRVAGTTRPGSGESYTNWVHLEDIVGAIDFAKDKQLEGIYHLNSDELMTTKEFLGRLFAAHDLPAVTWDSSQTSSRAYNMKLSNQKIKSAGFELAHPKIEFT